MPKASAPKAPWVLVWLSPQTIVVPGRVKPCSGPMTWTMPWRMSRMPNSWTPNSSQLLVSVSTWMREVSSAIGMRAVAGRHVVVGHGQRRVGAAHLAAGQPQALEGLRAGHLVDQVAVDVEEAGAVRLLVDEMRVPDLLEQRARRRSCSCPPRPVGLLAPPWPRPGGRRGARRCAPTCRCGRADNRAWRAGRDRGGRPRCCRCAGCAAGRRARRPRRRRSCAR